MKKSHFIRTGWILLLATLVLGVSFITPALASSNIARHTAAHAQPAASTAISATVYLTLGMLQPKFQQGLDRQVPVDVNNDINAMVSSMPAQDQGWARTMATTLIQPTASLQSLVPQQNGLAMTILLSLYPGDPKPTSAGMLVSFSVLDSNTVQVSTGALNNTPPLSSGPQSTFQVPIGVLTTTNATPACGDSALALHLQIPVALGQSSLTSATSAQTRPAQASAAGHGNPMAVMLNSHKQDLSDTYTYIEIPAASLTSLNGSFGNIPVSGGFTAQNIRVTFEGSTIHILSDIYWSGLNLGTADTTIAPAASGGNLVLNVTNTNFSLFGLFNFPMNNYNQQIQQMLNSKIGNAFVNLFTVTHAAIGRNSLIPCAKSDSLILTGYSNLG
ncbi:MAG TPA: hypothetical protein VKR83_11390 [Ktedonobacteraceae bacterium]|nr:hypothetical protein [Ktedonobacteraceae bacterium]